MAILGLPTAPYSVNQNSLTFFQRGGRGFYVPPSQHIPVVTPAETDCLMEDLIAGFKARLEDEQTILLIGTIILISETNPSVNIKPHERRALPSQIDYLIDGQQHLSILALLSTVLYFRLSKIIESVVGMTNNKLDDGTVSELTEIKQEVKRQLVILEEFFSVDLKRGTPNRKPIIIWGSTDCWTFDGSEIDNYQSETSRHLACVIRAIDSNSDFPWPRKDGNVKRTLLCLNRHLDSVIEAHNGISNKFPAARHILEGLPQEELWSYERPKLTEVIRNHAFTVPGFNGQLFSLVQLLAFTSFFKRCYFNVIQATASTRYCRKGKRL